MPPALKQLQQLLTKGLQATATLWPPLQNVYRFVHQAKEILANSQQEAGQYVRERYLALLAQMRDEIATLGPLASAFEHFWAQRSHLSNLAHLICLRTHFCHITDNFAAGLFQCYDVEGLPRTNNELEHCFGVARVHERRATGRRGAIPGVVVRGSVRVMAAVVTPQQFFSAEELRPRDYQRWRDLRRQLQHREESRRQQWRFRKDPAAYLAAIEARLLQ